MMFLSSQINPISKVSPEDITLVLVLKKHSGYHFNKARIKLILMFILPLVKKSSTLIDCQILSIQHQKVTLP
jgi:hypothetical protein